MWIYFQNNDFFVQQCLIAMAHTVKTPGRLTSVHLIHNRKWNNEEGDVLIYYCIN